MRLIKAFVGSVAVDQVVRALEAAGVPGVTVSTVHGAGYRYEPEHFNLAPRDVAHAPRIGKVEVVLADGLRRQAVELIGYARSIRLSTEQQQAKSEALASITAPCGNRNSLAVGCCPCNLGKSINGLANRMIAQEGADAPKVRQAVLDWIARTNPGGYSGAACDRKRCERPFHEDGFGGMSEARLVG